MFSSGAPRKFEGQWTCSGSTYIPEAQNAFIMKLKEPVFPLDFEVYIFHTCKEILEYNTKQYPKNSFVRLIGVYKTYSSIQYIEEEDFEITEKKFIIILNLGTIEKPSKLNELIEVFGQLEFKTIVGKDVPFVMVHFFKGVEGNTLRYKNYLKLQRKFLPKCCLEMVQKP